MQCGSRNLLPDSRAPLAGISIIETRGLTHIGLAVRDPDRSLRFYEQAFGVRECYRDEDTVQVFGPGAHDVIAFERDESRAGRRGGVTHFGFRLLRADDIDVAVREVERAGGKLVRRGEFVPGEPYAFFLDPDGHEIEVWFE